MVAHYNVALPVAIAWMCSALFGDRQFVFRNPHILVTGGSGGLQRPILVYAFGVSDGGFSSVRPRTDHTRLRTLRVCGPYHDWIDREINQQLARSLSFGKLLDVQIGNAGDGYASRNESFTGAILLAREDHSVAKTRSLPPVRPLTIGEV